MSRKRIFGTAILAAADRSLRQECARAGPRQHRVLAWGEDPTATGTLDTRVCTASATSSCPAISVSYTANGTIHEPGPGHNSRDGSTNTDANAITLAVRG